MLGRACSSKPWRITPANGCQRIRLQYAALAAIASLALVGTASASVRWFHSPSGNIQCEVSSGGSRGAHAYCQTFQPARSATLHRNGRTTICLGGRCLGNGPENAFTLRYGRSTIVGPFRCTSLQSGIKCVVRSSGHGFKIAKEGIRRI